MLPGGVGWTAVNVFRKDLYLGTDSDSKVQTDECVI